MPIKDSEMPITDSEEAVDLAKEVRMIEPFSVACAHQAEEEVRLLAVEGPEAHLVDDEERAVEVAPRFEPAGRDRRVPLEHVHQVIEHEVDGAEPVLDVLHAERHGEVALPTPGGPMKEDVVRLAYEGARGEGLEPGSIGRGLEGPIEALEGLSDWQPAEPGQRIVGNGCSARRSARNASATVVPVNGR